MILAFALIVIIEDVEQQPSYWANVYRCNEFAEAIEHQKTSPRSRKREYGQQNITAFCKPVWVPKNQELLD
jgi:hypothetical protein